MNSNSPIQLCVTHSPLVTRVFEAAMRLRGIPDTDVRSIGRRGAPMPGKGLRLDDISDGMDACFRKFDRAGYAALRVRLDNSLRELTGGQPFEACVPHLNKMLYQEIIAHPDCAAYSFLEEGFTSIAWQTRRNRRARASKLVLNSLRSLCVRPHYRFTRPMFDHSMPHYHAAYAISGRAFAGMPGRVCLKAHVPPLPSGSGTGNTYIVLDACYVHQQVRWGDYEDALVAAVRGHATGGLFVKFHFSDDAAPEHFQSIRTRLAGGGNPEPVMLPDGFSLEEHLTSMDVLVFATTSLGYYTALLGGHVVCFAGAIKGMDVSAWIADGRLPADFPQVVGLVE
jgi:hypothetical protein